MNRGVMAPAFQAKIHDAVGPTSAPVWILYINPNSTLAFTKESVEYLAPRLPPHVHVDFYTAPSTTPGSIDGTLDGVLSAADIARELGITTREGAVALGKAYDAVVVSCFSMHPLVNALRESLGVVDRPIPVIGIMEAGITAAMQLGSSFGIATTGRNWEALFDEGVRTLGIAPSKYTGTRGTGFNAVGLHGDGPASALLEASVDLVSKGAKVIVLGCAGMAPMRAGIASKLQDQTGKTIPVIDGVQAGLDQAISLASMFQP